jgi:hypothetical protein
VDQHGIEMNKSTKDLVFEFDKSDSGNGDILFKRHGDDMLAIRNNGSIEMKKIGDDRLAIRPDGKLALEGEDTDFIMDALPGGPNETGLKFAMEGVEKHSIEMDKTTMDLVVEFDKNDSGTGDILFKRHGDDMLAIRNNGNVGIGNSNPTARLDVAGSVRVADDPQPPTMENVGAIRYRELGDPVTVSLCEMVMQVGPGIYEWVIIRENSW